MLQLAASAKRAFDDAKEKARAAERAAREEQRMAEEARREREAEEEQRRINLLSPAAKVDTCIAR